MKTFNVQNVQNKQHWPNAAKVNTGELVIPPYSHCSLQGGIETRPGTKKRCPHNLQSGPVKTWTAVLVIINIAINLFGIVFKICVFCRGKVSGERLISHGTYCQYRTREYSMEATSLKTLLFSHCLVCCSGEWISCELYGSNVSIVYTWRTGLRQTFQS